MIILTKKKSLITFIKAPMAHKKFSKEQQSYIFFKFKLLFKVFFRNIFYLTSIDKILFLLNKLNTNSLNIQTNVFFF